MILLSLSPGVLPLMWKSFPIEPVASFVLHRERAGTVNNDEIITLQNSSFEIRKIYLLILFLLIIRRETDFVCTYLVHYTWYILHYRCYIYGVLLTLPISTLFFISVSFITISEELMFQYIVISPVNHWRLRNFRFSDKSCFSKNINLLNPFKAWLITFMSHFRHFDELCWSHSCSVHAVCGRCMSLSSPQGPCTGSQSGWKRVRFTVLSNQTPAPGHA